MKGSIKAVLGCSILAMILSGCGAARHVPTYHDASNPLRRVAVLPMKNDTNDVDGPNVVRKRMIEALQDRSYVVKDVKETDQVLRDQMGITLGGQLELTTAQKLGEVLGVEGVLYGTLMDFDETNTGILDVRKVRAKFRLVNTGTGIALWERGLGVRAETRMAGRTGSVASVVARGSDARDKEVPWVTVESQSSGESNVGKAFAVGLGAKILTKAIGLHLEAETKEMVSRLFDSIPWGPGAGDAPPVHVSTPKFMVPAVAMPEPPSFGYMDYGKKDFAAILIAETVQKGSRETVRFEMALAKAGERLRMEMDLSKMSKSGENMPPALSKMTTIHRGDKKVSYTLYDNSKRFVTHQQTGDQGGRGEVPKVTKTKVGSEVIDGHPTDKYRVTFTYKNGRTEEGFFWNARDLDEMTIRTETENKESRVTTELKRISLRTPPASLFEIPAGYTEAQNFMELMTGAQ